MNNLRRTIVHFGWYPISRDGIISPHDFSYRADNSTILVVITFDNPGCFFRNRRGPASWDTVGGKVVVFFDPNVEGGYGVTIELFLIPEKLS